MSYTLIDPPSDNDKKSSVRTGVLVSNYTSQELNYTTNVLVCDAGICERRHVCSVKSVLIPPIRGSQSSRSLSIVCRPLASAQTQLLKIRAAAQQNAALCATKCFRDLGANRVYPADAMEMALQPRRDTLLNTDVGFFLQTSSPHSLTHVCLRRNNLLLACHKPRRRK